MIEVTRNGEETKKILDKWNFSNNSKDNIYILTRYFKNNEYAKDVSNLCVSGCVRTGSNRNS
jgi:hypothetical protein